MDLGVEVCTNLVRCTLTAASCIQKGIMLLASPSVPLDTVGLDLDPEILNRRMRPGLNFIKNNTAHKK